MTSRPLVFHTSAYGYLAAQLQTSYRVDKGTLETKLIFDCTRPLSAGKFPAATRVPPDVKERMNPGDYVRPLSEADLASLRGGK